jgi:hypothetical protein
MVFILLITNIPPPLREEKGSKREEIDFKRTCFFKKTTEN